MTSGRLRLERLRDRIRKTGPLSSLELAGPAVSSVEAFGTGALESSSDEVEEDWKMRLMLSSGLVRDDPESELVDGSLHSGELDPTIRSIGFPMPSDMARIVTFAEMGVSNMALVVSIRSSLESSGSTVEGETAGVIEGLRGPEL